MHIVEVQFTVKVKLTLTNQSSSKICMLKTQPKRILLGSGCHFFLNLYHILHQVVGEQFTLLANAILIHAYLMAILHVSMEVQYVPIVI